MVLFSLGVEMLKKEKIGYLSGIIPKENNVGIQKGQLTLTKIYRIVQQEIFFSCIITN